MALAIDKATLDMLGLSEEEMRDRVVQAVVDRLLVSINVDEDGDDYEGRSVFHAKMEAYVKDSIDRTVKEVGERRLGPDLDKRIEDFILQETNTWGEKKGEPVSFTEYLVKRAEAFMSEQVNYEGLTRQQNRSSMWKPTGTRVEYMIDKHLQYNIQVAVERVLKTANEHIAEGLSEAVKVKLKELSEAIKISVGKGR